MRCSVFSIFTGREGHVAARKRKRTCGRFLFNIEVVNNLKYLKEGIGRKIIFKNSPTITLVTFFLPNQSRYSCSYLMCLRLSVV